MTKKHLIETLREKTDNEEKMIKGEAMPLALAVLIAAAEGKINIRDHQGILSELTPKQLQTYQRVMNYKNQEETFSSKTTAPSLVTAAFQELLKDGKVATVSSASSKNAAEPAKHSTSETDPKHKPYL